MNLNWLKLDVNILDDQKIKLIRKYPDGNGILVLWIGLLCHAMKSDVPGFIYIAHGIPYTAEDLANILDIEKKTVELGLQLFNQYGMIDIVEGGVIEIINFNKYQDLEKIENRREKDRIRQQNFRQKAISGVTRDSTVTNDTVTVQSRVDKIREDKSREEEIKLFQTENFEKFWNLYDKKVERASCEKKWSKINPDSYQLIFSHVEMYVKSTQDKQFRKNPETYLNNQCWNDEIIQSGKTQKNPSMNDTEKRLMEKYT